MGKHSKKKKRSPLLPDWRLRSLPRLLDAKKERPPLEYKRTLELRELIVLTAAVLLFLLALLLPVPDWAETAILGVSTFCAAWSIILRCAESAFRRKLPLEELYCLIGLGLAFTVDLARGAAIAAILIRFVEIAQAYAERRSDAALDLVRDALPERANIETADGSRRVMPEEVIIGDVLLVGAEQSLALDGVVLEGVSEVDTSALTGNSSPRAVKPGDEVLAGYRNLSSPLRVRVTQLFEDSAAARLLVGVEQAARKRTRLARVAEKASRIWRMGIGVLALLAALLLPLTGLSWRVSLGRAAALLLISSPSSLVIAFSLCYFGAMLSALRQGILMKTQDCFERLANTSKLVFGKTGTITEGRFRVTDVFPAQGVGEEQLLAVAAAAESHSRHPIAVCLREAGGWTPELGESVMDVDEIPGRGISAFIEGRVVYVGNSHLLEDHGIWCPAPSRPGSAIHVAVEDRYWGHIMLTDQLRDGAFDALEALRSLGVDELVMLTGDVWSVSRPIALSVNFDWVKAELDPAGKLSVMGTLLSSLGSQRTLAYVGDGINDAPMMQKADIGIAVNAMRTWNESKDADIAILDDEIQMLPAVMSISAGVQKIALWNLLGLGGLKLLLALLCLTGALPIAAAAILDAVGGVAALYNALRAFDLE